MNRDASTGQRTRQVLTDTDGRGVVRLSDRLPTDPDDLWSALTEPDRLRRWLGEVTGGLREGGEFDARYYASGWEGHCVIEVCDPPRRLLIRTHSEDDGDGAVEITLTPNDDGTTSLVLEDRGMPPEAVADYGAGNEVHLDDLVSHLAGGDRCDPRERWQSVLPEWQSLGTT